MQLDEPNRAITASTARIYFAMSSVIIEIKRLPGLKITWLGYV